MPAERDSADEDRDLVERARGGDHQAFAAIVRRHQHRVLALAYGFVGNRADAEDVAQEAFLRVYRGLGRFRGASTFRTWLSRIVTNTARTHRARRVSRPEMPVDDRESDVYEATASGERLEDALVARDQVARALASLPHDLREAVVLRDVEGLDYREIADLLQVPIGTVESRIFRGRARLRAELGEARG